MSITRRRRQRRIISREPSRSALVRVLILPPSSGLGGLLFRRSLEQETEVRRDERVGRHHRVGVVDGPVLAREGDPARALTQPVLELGPDLACPLLEPVGRLVDHLLDLGNLRRLLLGQRKTEVEGEVGVVGGDVGELPAHPPLVGGQPLDRRAREAEQRHVAVAQVDERAVEPVAQVGAAGAGAEGVVGAEHDVVGKQLRAPVEELGEGLLAVLGVELVLLLDRDPGEIEALSLDLLVSLRLLGLELGELVSGRLPLLAGSDLMFRHLISSRRTRALPREPNPSSDRTLPGHKIRPAATRKLIATVLEPQLALTPVQYLDENAWLRCGSGTPWPGSTVRAGTGGLWRPDRWRCRPTRPGRRRDSAHRS